jgi:hypothetical protein
MRPSRGRRPAGLPEGKEWIDIRRPYRIKGEGLQVLREQLQTMRQIVSVASDRLATV